MAICKAQQKGQFYEMQTAVIPLLKQALCAQQGKFQAILSGELDILAYIMSSMMPDSRHSGGLACKLFHLLTASCFSSKSCRWIWDNITAVSGQIQKHVASCIWLCDALTSCREERAKE